MTLADLPDRAVSWVGEQLGDPVASAAVLTGGFSSQMYAVRGASGREAVLRRMTIQPWRRFAQTLLAREFAVQSMLAGTSIPVPEPIAVDLDGTASGEPSLLMSRLPGTVDIVRHDHDYLHQLAALLVQIHAFRPGDGEWPREYQSWAFESKFVVPPWSRQDALWEQAFDILRCAPPSYSPAFLHRDFYPANVLWRDGGITGLVDWVETSTGPVDLDVAHCCTNLASLHGLESAQRFRAAYAEAGGVLETDPDASTYWQLMDLVAFLPEAGRESGATPELANATWTANGRPDLTAELRRCHREDLLAAILG